MNINDHFRHYGYPTTNPHAWGAFSHVGNVLLRCWVHEHNEEAKTFYLFDPEDLHTCTGMKLFNARERLRMILAIKAGARGSIVRCIERKGARYPGRERIKEFDPYHVWRIEEIVSLDNGQIYARVSDPIAVHKLRS